MQRTAGPYKWVIHVGLGLSRTFIHFRFAPKATELLRRHEVTRCANKGHSGGLRTMRNV